MHITSDIFKMKRLRLIPMPESLHKTKTQNENNPNPALRRVIPGRLF